MPPQTDNDVLELTQDELEQMIEAQAEARVTAALELAREQDRERFETLEAEAREARVESHKSRVNDRIRELQDAGHAPAVLKAAKQLMLADTDHAEALTLEQSDDEGHISEVKLSVTDAVELLLEAVPATALTRNQPRLATQRASEETVEYDPAERAKQLLDDARKGATTDL